MLVAGQTPCGECGWVELIMARHARYRPTVYSRKAGITERHRQKLTVSKLKAGVGSGDSRPTAVARLTDVPRGTPPVKRRVMADRLTPALSPVPQDASFGSRAATLLAFDHERGPPPCTDIDDGKGSSVDLGPECPSSVPIRKRRPSLLIFGHAVRARYRGVIKLRSGADQSQRPWDAAHSAHSQRHLRSLGVERSSMEWFRLASPWHAQKQRPTGVLERAVRCRDDGPTKHGRLRRARFKLPHRMRQACGSSTPRPRRR